MKRKLLIALFVLGFNAVTPLLVSASCCASGAACCNGGACCND